ncbi:hypothetical protein AArc1_5149 (plasmid) [Natrarchaeobaculum sulfurireducens]|uniref:Uncharacterized protein n=1 Tax=Natrarchaeobaculum sulfurireducens TaxID=2044521 RepID=A0A346PA05_9EURY|nr:hypothetical protein AArc1_5149 [Natrarchaeobaculum sulfurireducens]
MFGYVLLAHGFASFGICLQDLLPFVCRRVGRCIGFGYIIDNDQQLFEAFVEQAPTLYSDILVTIIRYSKSLTYPMLM